MKRSGSGVRIGQMSSQGVRPPGVWRFRARPQAAMTSARGVRSRQRVSRSERLTVSSSTVRSTRPSPARRPPDRPPILPADALRRRRRMAPVGRPRRHPCRRSRPRSGRQRPLAASRSRRSHRRRRGRPARAPNQRGGRDAARRASRCGAEPPRGRGTARPSPRGRLSGTLPPRGMKKHKAAGPPPVTGTTVDPEIQTVEQLETVIPHRRHSVVRRGPHRVLCPYSPAGRPSGVKPFVGCCGAN